MMLLYIDHHHTLTTAADVLALLLYIDHRPPPHTDHLRTPTTSDHLRPPPHTDHRRTLTTAADVLALSHDVLALSHDVLSLLLYKVVV